MLWWTPFRLHCIATFTLPFYIDPSQIARTENLSAYLIEGDRQWTILSLSLFDYLIRSINTLSPTIILIFQMIEHHISFVIYVCTHIGRVW